MTTRNERKKTKRNRRRQREHSLKEHLLTILFKDTVDVRTHLLHLSNSSILAHGSTSTTPNFVRLREVYHKWNEFSTNILLYADAKHPEFRDWCLSEKTGHQLMRIRDSVAALEEIRDPLVQKKLGMPEQELHQIEKRILDILYHQLLKMEKLRIKHIAAEENWLEEVKDKSLVTGELEELKEKKSRLEENLYRQIKKEPIGELYKEKLESAPMLLLYFMHHEKKSVKLKKHFARADITADTSGVGGSLGGIIPPVFVVAKGLSDTSKSVVEFTNPVWKISSGMWAVASGIPILAALIAVVPASLAAARSWLGNKGWSDRAINTSMAALFITAAVLTVLFPVAASIIACGVIATGVVINNVKPWLELRHKVKSRENELKQTDDRIRELVTDKPINDLIEIEKSAIIKRLETYLKHPENYASSHTITAAKALVANGKISDIENYSSPEAKLLMKVISGEKNEFKTVKEFLVVSNNQYSQYLQKEIHSLKEKRNSQLAQSINGLATITGAVMVCIPFPPIQIAGAAILLTSCVVGVALKYDLHKKAWNGIKNLFQNKKNPATPAVVTTKNKPGLQHQHALSHTKTRLPSSEVKIHQALSAESPVPVPKLDLSALNTNAGQELQTPRQQHTVVPRLNLSAMNTKTAPEIDTPILKPAGSDKDAQGQPIETGPTQPETPSGVKALIRFFNNKEASADSVMTEARKQSQVKASRKS